MSKLSGIGQTALIMVVIVLILAAGAAGYLKGSSRIVTSTVTTTEPPVTTTIPSVTKTVYTSYVNTYFSTSCVISAIGGFEFRIVSDSTGQPVNADSINAVDRLGCDNTIVQENQIVYLNNFSQVEGGWLEPVFPTQAIAGGSLNITVTYEGKAYNFAGYYPPVGTDCVTLSVPSGNVSSTTVMNGSGSYCSAATSSTSVTQTSNANFSSSTNKLGLELLASVNSTDLSQSDTGLLLNMTLMNTLSTQNNVSYANSWAISNMSRLGEICSLYSPTSFAVFSGNYGLNNISLGTPLNVWPIVPACPAPLITNGTSSSVIGALRNVTSYSFFPNSDMANYSVYYIPWGSTNETEIFGTFPITVSQDQSIYISNNSSEPTISYVPSAASSVYTLAVGDEWGDLVLIHFTVSGCGPFGCDESTITASSGETP